MDIFSLSKLPLADKKYFLAPWWRVQGGTLASVAPAYMSMPGPSGRFPGGWGGASLDSFTVKYNFIHYEIHNMSVKVKMVKK